MTIRDVAEKARVSVATVSRVLNDDPKVKPHLRARVLEAVAEMGYRPNRLAAHLRTQRTRLVGLIIPDIRNPFFIDVVRGIQDKAVASGYTVILCNSDDSLDKERAYLDVAQQDHWAGVIMLPFGSDCEPYRETVAARIPLVVIDRRVPGLNADTVLVDNVGGTRSAIRHLIGLGHRRIGFVAGPGQFTPGAGRLQGYREALAEAGIAGADSLIVDGLFTEDGGYRACRWLLNLPDRPTAIFSSSNLMTVGVLTALNECGVRIPEEVALAGFDDLPWARLLHPPLTAVVQPGYEMGVRAMSFLLDRINGDNAAAAPREVIMQPTLQVRQSCGAGRPGVMSR